MLTWGRGQRIATADVDAGSAVHRAVHRVAIVGGGVAGSALACFIKDRGFDCIVFDDGRSRDLLVGESLVPAVMPILRRLGVLDDVAAISQIKRGAAFRNQSGDRVDFRFRRFGSHYPDYAFNVPRPQFDNLIKARATAKGVRFVNARAQVERCFANPTRDLQLSIESLHAAGLTRETQPDLLIDASGRSRLFSRLLNIGADRGPRSDVAHFAHFENFDSHAAFEGQVVLTALDCGWSWQIPLPDATSVGVVMDATAVKALGRDPEERLERAIRLNPVLREAGLHRKRVSAVQVYSKYQLLSQRAHGRGWVLLGDALGFVDPMLSPGVFMALETAQLLDELLFSQAAIRSPQRAVSERVFDEACTRYYAEVCAWHEAWSSLINYFYDGRILSMGSARHEILTHSRPWAPQRLAEKVVSRSLAQLVSGINTRSILHRSVLEHSCAHILRTQAHLDHGRPKSLAIRSRWHEAPAPVSPVLSDTRPSKLAQPA